MEYTLNGFMTLLSAINSTILQYNEYDTGDDDDGDYMISLYMHKQSALLKTSVTDKINNLFLEYTF